MTSKLDLIRIVAVLALSACVSTGAWAGEDMAIKRVTTTVLVEDVDACIPFWTERLGFEQTITVPAQQPGETGTQFVAVNKGKHEVMFQSFMSADEELPGLFALNTPQSFLLYVEVSDLDAMIERMNGLEPTVSRRTTFYGSQEIGYLDPCGTLVILAEFPAASANDSIEIGTP